MNDRTALRFAMVASGLALAISLFGLWTMKKNLQVVTDHELRLDADLTKLRATVDENQKNTALMLANEMTQLCVELGGGEKCGQGEAASNEPQPFPDALVSKIGVPAAKGAEIRVKIPAEVAKAIVGEPARLAAEGGLVPDVKDGKPAGFRIDELRQGGVGPALGFEKDDALRKINGKSIRDTGELAEAWNDVVASKTWTIDLERGGKAMKLVIETGKP